MIVIDYPETTTSTNSAAAAAAAAAAAVTTGTNHHSNLGSNNNLLQQHYHLNSATLPLSIPSTSATAGGIILSNCNNSGDAALNIENKLSSLQISSSSGIQATGTGNNSENIQLTTISSLNSTGGLNNIPSGIGGGIGGGGAAAGGGGGGVGATGTGTGASTASSSLIASTAGIIGGGAGVGNNNAIYYYQQHRNSSPVITGNTGGNNISGGGGGGSGGIIFDPETGGQQNSSLASSGGIAGTAATIGGTSSGGPPVITYRGSTGSYLTAIMDPSHHVRPHTGAGFTNNRLDLYQKCNRGSHSSDTSSAYSGSDTMTSVNSSSLDADEVDLSGLVESVVDSDEEDLAESMDSLNVRDAVRDCLEKDPSERTEDDIKILLDFTQTLKAFTNMTLAVRRALCSVMVFAVVDKAGTMVMSDGEELDSWSVLINGCVEIEHSNGDKEELQVGDSFGILPTMDKLYHRGVMRTKCDDCNFVCITQTDYFRIQHQGEENTKRHEENGQVVMVTELRHIGIDANTALRRGHVVIRGSPERLMLQLIEENSITDPTYVEDFLLTHRTFIDDPKKVTKQLLEWFENEDTSPQQTTATSSEIRDRVTRVILLWVNNHFTDFETDTEMMELLETFESGLEKKNMLGALRLLHIACAAKARTRTVTLTRSSRDENLHFTIIGGYERNSYGIFISKVDKKTKADDVGLKRGDQILEVNGKSFEHVTYNRAMEILLNSTHLSITVKSNLLVFKEMLQASDNNSPRPRQNRRRLCASDIVKLQATTDTRAAARLSTVELLGCSTGIGNTISVTSDQVDCSSSNNQSPFKQFNHITATNTAGAGAGIHKKDTLSLPVGLKGPQISSTTLSISSIVTTTVTSATSTCSALSTGSSTSSSSSTSSTSYKGGFMTLGPKRRLQKALIKMNLLPKNTGIDAGNDDEQQQQQQRSPPSTISSSATTTATATNGTLPNSHLILGINSNNYLSGNTNSVGVGSVGNSITGGIISTSVTTPGGSNGSTMRNNSTLISNNHHNNHNYYNSSNNINSNHHNNNNNTILIPNQSGLGQLYHSHSNPDLTTIFYEDNRVTDYPEHVLKVYKSDQTCKYLLINKETTAHEVVMLALREFGIHETSSNFSLCEVSVGDGGMIKQRRLPDQLQNLAERIGLCSRYYLKTNGITETLVPDDMAPDLVRESTVHFLQLNANEIAIQLTLQDFSIFRQIESTEYVDDLFELKSKYGTPMLKQFSELVNREMFLVVTEVCSEHNVVRRMKIIKQFIKVARHLKECRNFNSMFAIISGLGHVAVLRLRQTWEKLPTKYQKLFADLQDFMDPSRNMSKYRQLVSAELIAQHPIIPFYPVVKKDLTFIHLGNDTHVENLINFEKLRMIAKEVRLLTHMCSSAYDLLTMLEFKGQPPSSAMVALNQMSVTNGPHGSGGSAGGLLHVGTGTGSGSGGGGGQATVKRRKKSTAAPNPKKMFEEAQMIRRVKAYLNNMKVITDEDELHALSLECEPSNTTSNSGGGGSSGGGGGSGSAGSSGGGGGGGGGSGNGGSGSAPSSVTIRKRHPSPTLSTTSSTSSTSEGKKGSLGGPKFGAQSPQAVKKILSLSEQTKTRPHQPRHPGLPLPLVSHPHNLYHNHPLHTSTSPSPSPGSLRRIGPGGSGPSSATGPAPGMEIGGICNSSSQTATTPGAGGRAVHERSHSDTPTPLPSVDLSMESSSVTSLSNLPLRKTITSGSVTSSDSGHGSCVQADTHSNCSEGSTGLYHVASSIVHNSPSPTLQQRRHSAVHGHNVIAPPPPKGLRHPPAYSVAAQMARLHRLGRAHSHEGVTTTSTLGSPYYHPAEHGGDEDDDEDAQVSAV